MLLKNGSTGNYVMYLQYGLHIMCCPPGSFDSKFGSGTENAVQQSACAAPVGKAAGQGAGTPAQAPQPGA